MVMGFDIASKFARATLARPGGDVGATTCPPTYMSYQLGRGKSSTQECWLGGDGFLVPRKVSLNSAFLFFAPTFSASRKRCVWDKTLSFGWDL